MVFAKLPGPSEMFVPHFTTIQSETEAPRRWMLVMHGIYGRGGNWRTVARKLVAACPTWGAVLVDLRMHGKSQGAEAPHTLAACARDGLALLDSLAVGGREVGAIIGHSFGGKVALAMREVRPELCPIWLIDSSPSPRPGAIEDPSNTVVSVLRMLEELPREYDERAEFVSAVQERGYPEGLAQWLAMNLEPANGRYRNALDPAAMRDLLSDYFARDLWPVVEGAIEPIYVAIASRASAVSEQDRERFRKCPQAQTVAIEGGHWLHVDATESLVREIAATLS